MSNHDPAFLFGLNAEVKGKRRSRPNATGVIFGPGAA
jgi:hypothetical protein